MDPEEDRKPTEVELAEEHGYVLPHDSMGPELVCPDCHAVVRYWQQHLEWHESLKFDVTFK